MECVSVKKERIRGQFSVFFPLYDIYDLNFDKLNENYFRLDTNGGTSYIFLLKHFFAWHKEKEK